MQIIKDGRRIYERVKKLRKTQDLLIAISDALTREVATGAVGKLYIIATKTHYSIALASTGSGQFQL